MHKLVAQLREAIEEEAEHVHHVARLKGAGKGMGRGANARFPLGKTCNSILMLPKRVKDKAGFLQEQPHRALNVC